MAVGFTANVFLCRADDPANLARGHLFGGRVKGAPLLDFDEVHPGRRDEIVDFAPHRASAGPRSESRLSDKGAARCLRRQGPRDSYPTAPRLGYASIPEQNRAPWTGYIGKMLERLLVVQTQAQLIHIAFETPKRSATSRAASFSFGSSSHLQRRLQGGVGRCRLRQCTARFHRAADRFDTFQQLAQVPRRTSSNFLVSSRQTAARRSSPKTVQAALGMPTFLGLS